MHGQSKITIRRAKVGDFEPVAELLRDAGLMYPAGPPEFDTYFDGTYFGDILANPQNRSCFVAENKFEVVGVVLADHHGSHHVATLDRIAVRVDRRKQGIGHSLNMRAIEQCTRWGASTIHAYVRPENAASRAMLQKEGFTIERADHQLDLAVRSLHHSTKPPSARLLEAIS